MFELPDPYPELINADQSIRFVLIISLYHLAGGAENTVPAPDPQLLRPQRLQASPHVENRVGRTQPDSQLAHSSSPQVVVANAHYFAGSCSTCVSKGRTGTMNRPLGELSSSLQ